MDMPTSVRYSPSMNRTQITQKIVSARQALESEGVLHVALFGSRARGDFRSDSDVDILLDVAPQSRFSILNLVGVEEIITKATGLKSNAVMRRSLDEGFKSSVAKDVVEVF
jgi:uncharacterized protein